MRERDNDGIPDYAAAYLDHIWLVYGFRCLLLVFWVAALALHVMLRRPLRMPATPLAVSFVMFSLFLSSFVWTARSKRRRRTFQALTCAALAAGVVLTAVAFARYRAWQAQEARIAKAGGKIWSNGRMVTFEGDQVSDASLALLKHLPELKTVYVSDCKVTDAGLAHLRRLTGIQELRLAALDGVTDAGLEHLAGLPNLASLDLSTLEQLTEAGLRHLGALPRLRSLHLAGPVITDEGVAHLVRLRHLETVRFSARLTAAGLARLRDLPKLKELELWPVREMTSDRLAQLGRLAQLEVLELSYAHLNDDHLVHLKGLTNLHKLNLTGSWVTDAGLAHLAALSTLAELDLSGTKVTDAGLKHLRVLRNLKVLGLADTRVTTAGAKSLEARIPGLTVTR